MANPRNKRSQVIILATDAQTIRTNQAGAAHCLPRAKATRFPPPSPRSTEKKRSVPRQYLAIYDYRAFKTLVVSE